MGILSSWNRISWCSLKTALYLLDPSCHHLPLETVITEEKPLITPLTLWRSAYKQNFASQIDSWPRGLLYFVRQHRGLELSVSGTWGINVESRKSTPLKAFSAWIQQNYSEWPQLPLSRFPNFARIQALAVLHKQSVALGIQFGLYILTKTVTPW